MSESSIHSFGLLISLVLIVFALRRRGDLPVLVFVCLAPLSYFAVNFGFVLTPAKLIGLVFVLYIILNWSLTGYLNNPFLKKFMGYYWYVILVTILMSMLWPSNNAAAQGLLYSSAMRGWVQIFQVLIGLSIVIFFLHHINTPESLKKIQTALLFSMLFLAIYGLYVWYAQGHGLPFNTITRQGGLTGSESGRVIWTDVGGVRAVRAYSLSGEPKGLAINSCFGLVLLLFTAASDVKLIETRFVKLIVALILLLTLYLTYSTAGYLVLPMLLGTALYLTMQSRQLTTRMVSGFFGMGFIGLFYVVYQGDYIMESLNSVYSERVGNRLSDQGLFTYAEASMTKFWKDSPFHMLSGVGLGGSSFYVRLYDTDSYQGFVAAPRGVIGFIGDKGLVGLWLFAMAMYQTTKILLFATMSESPNRKIYVGTIVVCVTSFVLMLTYSQWYMQWLAVGLACAGATIASQDSSVMR